jgi:hypothetical protein
VAWLAIKVELMKLKLSRTLVTWPEDKHAPVRLKGSNTSRIRSFQVIEKDGKSLEGIEGEHQYMPSQLCHDINSDYSVQMTTKAIEDVASGQIPEWEGTGNAWTVVLRPDGATFEFSIMDGEPGGKVSLEIYRRALEAWRDFLADESCDERIVELPD